MTRGLAQFLTAYELSADHGPDDLSDVVPIPGGVPIRYTQHLAKTADAGSFQSLMDTLSIFETARAFLGPRVSAGQFLEWEHYYHTLSWRHPEERQERRACVLGMLSTDLSLKTLVDVTGISLDVWADEWTHVRWDLLPWYDLDHELRDTGACPNAAWCLERGVSRRAVMPFVIRKGGTVAHEQYRTIKTEYTSDDKATDVARDMLERYGSSYGAQAIWFFLREGRELAA